MKEQKTLGNINTTGGKEGARAPGKQKKERTAERLHRNKAFAAQLQAQADRKGIDRRRFASEYLDISGSYCNALMNGDRLWDEADFDIIRNAANFLGVPALGVLRILDIVRQEDWAVSQSVDMRKEMMNASLEKMRRDPQMAAYMPTQMQWDNDIEAVKDSAIQVYEVLWKLRMDLLIQQTGGKFSKLSPSDITPRPTQEEFEAVANARRR